MTAVCPVVVEGSHRLSDIFQAAARDRFPEPDGSVEILPAPPGRAMAVVAFTRHFVVATSAPTAWIRAELPLADLLAPTSPRFLSRLADVLGRRDDGVDLLLAASGVSDTTQLHPIDTREHGRVNRAYEHRDGVRAFVTADDVGVVSVGSGLAGRLEVSVEIEAAFRGEGRARRALQQARRLVPEDQYLFAQVAPGNAASLRAFLAAGFVPIGSEVLFF